MDWDDLNESHYDWPTVAETTKYREQVKKVILDVIDNSTTERIESWHCDMWVMLLGIEHERIHLETSAVIMRRVPLNMVRNVEAFAECPKREHNINKIPKNKMVNVPQWEGKWHRKLDDLETYGWDN